MKRMILITVTAVLIGLGFFSAPSAYAQYCGVGMYRPGLVPDPVADEMTLTTTNARADASKGIYRYPENRCMGPQWGGQYGPVQMHPWGR